MNKKIILLATIALAALAGCGPTDEPAATPAAAPTQQELSLMPPEAAKQAATASQEQIERGKAMEAQMKAEMARRNQGGK